MRIDEYQSNRIRLLQEKAQQFEGETYPFKNRFVLLITSYCSDNPECTDFRPCLDCLQMCNVAVLENNEITAICGYDYINNVKLKP